MNSLKQNSGDERLHSLLHESRAAPDLPPRFQENVWRRIEQGDSPQVATHWMAALASLILKPRFAFAAAATVLLAGALLGSLSGTEQAKRVAQERYVAAVVMPPAP